MAAQVLIFAETAGTVQGKRNVPVADRPVMGEDEWPGYLEKIARLADWMAENGVPMAFHHHMGTVVEKAARDRPPDGRDARDGGPALRHRPPHLRRRGPGGGR